MQTIHVLHMGRGRGRAGCKTIDNAVGACTKLHKDIHGRHACAVIHKVAPWQHI